MNEYQAVVQVSVGLVAANPFNPGERSEEGLESLVASVRQVGLIQPVTVATLDAFSACYPGPAQAVAGKFVVLDGHRRLAAAQLAGVGLIPVVVRDDLVGESDVVMLQTARERLALNPIQEAQVYARMSERGLSQRALAKHVGVSQSHIAKRLKLLRLPAAFQDAVANGLYSLEWALEIAKEPKGVQHRAAEVLAQTKPVDGSYDWSVEPGRLILAVTEGLARERMRKEAAKLGVLFVESHEELLKRLGHQYWRHHIRENEVASAKTEGQVFAASSGERLAFYREVAPEREASKWETAEAQRKKDAALSVKARQPFVAQLRTVKPSAAQRRKALLALAFSPADYRGWDQIMKRNGDTRDRHVFVAEVQRLSPLAQEKIAWALYVETGAFGLADARWQKSYGPMLRGFIEELKAVGYEPTAFDEERLAG